MRGASSSTNERGAAWVEHRATKMRASWGEGSQQIRTKVEGVKKGNFLRTSHMDALCSEECKSSN